MPLANVYQFSQALLDNDMAKVTVGQEFICRTGRPKLSKRPGAFRLESALLIDGNLLAYPDVKGVTAFFENIFPESR
jgi:hypothetical protein